jgi:HD superfamily phosphodiesterase
VQFDAVVSARRAKNERIRAASEMSAVGDPALGRAAVRPGQRRRDRLRKIKDRIAFEVLKTMRRHLPWVQ